MNFAKPALLSAALIVTPFAASAQDVGSSVYGNDDAPVGEVTANDGTTVTIDTGKHLAPLPANLLAEREGKWTINATQAQVNALMDQQVAEAAARRDALLVLDAAVTSADGTPAGTLTSVDLEGDALVLTNEAGPVALKKEHFAVDAAGALVVLFTNEQLAGAVASAQASAE